METSKIQVWNRTTEAIYKNVMLYTIAGMAAALFSIIPLMRWVSNVCNVLVVAGFIAFFIRLKDLVELVDEADKDAMKKLVTGVMVYIAALMLEQTPMLVNWILGPIGVIVSCVFMLLGYNALKKSETFPNREGMKTLFIAKIVGIVGGVLSIIPLIGIIGGICYIVMFVLVLLGWKKVAEPIAE
ncbi:MAG: hypothetical protein II662_02335 [Bacteroidales bacterium]|jgi:hypothetical protein|nr:hypothetical protein [Bacteroidales bacterium]